MIYFLSCLLFILCFLTTRSLYVIIVSFVLITLHTYCLLLPDDIITQLLYLRGGPGYFLGKDLFYFWLMISQVFIIFTSHTLHGFKINRYVDLPVFPVFFIKQAFLVKLFIALLLIAVYFVFGRRGIAGSLFDYLILLGCVSFFGGEKRLSVIFSSVFTILVLTLMGLRLPLFMEAVGLFLYIKKGGVLSKVHMLLGSLLLIIIFIFLGFARFGLDSIPLLLSDESFFQRLLLNNFAGSVVSSLALLDYVDLGSFSSIPYAIRSLIPLPTSIIGSEFDPSVLVSTPGGGALPVHLLSFFGLGFFVFFIVQNFYLIILKNNTLKDMGEIILTLLSLKVWLYGPAVLSTIPIVFLGIVSIMSMLSKKS